MKLALSNVRRSLRDYAIYFITLVFGVAVFYAFNAIDDSRVSFEVQEGMANADSDLFDSLSTMITIMSVVVAVVFGFLVFYANKYVVRRRKKEFGTYLLLDMRPSQVSSMVLVETVSVGVFAMLVGLVVGFGLSQLISLMTANMLGQALQSYNFVFSAKSCGMTVAYFVLIFAVVALFDVFQVSRCKLADLLSAHNRSEKMTMRNPWLCLVVFVMSVAMLAVAYQTLFKSGLVMLDDDFFNATALMLVSTFLLFWPLSGFAILVLSRLRGVYFKGLAMFTVRQIASRVNTAFISLWAVSILLFFSITIYSGGMGMASIFAGDVGATAPYDATFTSMTSILNNANGEQEQPDQAHILWEKYDGNMESCLSDTIPSWDDTITGAARIDKYNDPQHTNAELLDILVSISKMASSIARGGYSSLAYRSSTTHASWWASKGSSLLMTNLLSTIIFPLPTSFPKS